jgi:hypothetical protein
VTVSAGSSARSSASREGLGSRRPPTGFLGGPHAGRICRARHSRVVCLTCCSRCTIVYVTSNASTLIALASLALAAFTVLVNYLNVRRQAEAAMQAEHVKWLRDKRDDLYGRIISAIEGDINKRWYSLNEVVPLTVRYASDAVLDAVLSLSEMMYGDLSGVEDAKRYLTRIIREETVIGGAEKTRRRKRWSWNRPLVNPGRP